MVCTLLAGVNVVAFAADDLDDTISVQKFYFDATKGGNGEHIYTIDEDEISWYKSLPSWNDEGEAWKAPLFSENPVYRVANYNTGEHLWITDKGYVDYLVGLGWTQEQGIAFYSDDNKGVPVYRLWNGTDGVGSHHFTTNEEEIAWLVSTGWTNEGPQFYGVKEEPTEKEMTAAQTGENEITVATVEGEFTGLETFTVSHGDVADELANLEFDEELGVYVITLANEIEDATYTVTCSDTDFAAVTFEGTSELEILELEATGSKELTATLNRAAELDADDVIVKKGNVTLTPADVTCIGDTVVITLGSKIVKDTYSVTIENSTASVETEDEKLVEFKTVGTNIAQIDNDTFNPAGYSGAGTAVVAGEQLVAASIEYQALNQYGESISAEVLQITNTFGGATAWKEPTSKKNGEIVIYNVPATLGIQGTEGNLIVVSKNGVSSTCPVVMSEKAAVAHIEYLGLYNTNSGEIVDFIPAQTDASNYRMVVIPFDQYGRPISDAANLLGQQPTVSVAQMLSNVTIDGLAQGNLTAASLDTVEVNGQELAGIKLTQNTGDTVATAGTTRVIIVGKRFGTVLDETIEVKQMNLISSFTFSADDTIYANADNELTYTAIDTAGNEVTKYEDLKKLVQFTVGTGDNSTLKWEKQTDGTAKLIYHPASFTGTDLQNYKESEVLSATATCNATISPADQIVVPKTFTVYENQIPYSVVKYNGPTAFQGATASLIPSKLVIEDQYGNTLTSGQVTALGTTFDYAYPISATTYNTTTGASIQVLRTAAFPVVVGQTTKVGISISGMSNDAQGNFDYNKAQAYVSFTGADPRKVTNLKAVWKGEYNAQFDEYIDGTIHQVNADQETSGVDEDNFLVTGTYKGKTIVLTPDTDYQIVKDTYTPILEDEEDAKIGTAQVTIKVLLEDEQNQEYTEEIEAGYAYSAMNPTIAKIVGLGSLVDMDVIPVGPYGVTTGTAIVVKNAMAVPSSNMIEPFKAQLAGIAGVTGFNDGTGSSYIPLFVIVDQYGQMICTYENNAYVAGYCDGLTYEITPGKNTDNVVVTNSGFDTAAFKATATVTGGEIAITATLPNGMSATQKISLTTP